MKIDKFVIAIACVIALAYLFPQWGSKDSSIPLDIIGSIGVSLIFFFYGLKLSPDKIKAGLKNWKLHCLVQVSTFVLFPLLVIAFYPFFTNGDAREIWLSFLFLAALPSTVSSSVVMVSLAKGNVPAAIFNASISGLIGIAVTPLWLGLFLHPSGNDFHLGAIYIKLITEILLPVVLGILLQRWGGKYAIRYNRYLTLFDKSVILIIIYKSFASSFAEKVFINIAVADFLFITAGVVLLFYGVLFFTGFVAKRLKFSIADQITAQFCGTKKSLVHGTIFSHILFSSSFSMGIILLPLMIFHAFQLFIISIIATNLAKRSDSN